MTIIRPTTINARFSQPVGLGGEKLWLCPTLGGDRLDLSGNGNHANLGSASIVSSGRFRHFDSQITTSPSVSTNDLAPSTMACWVNNSLTSASTNRFIFNKTEKQLYIREGGTSNQRLQYLNDGSGGDLLGQTANAYTWRYNWTHFAVTWDGTVGSDVGSLFVNGVKSGSIGGSGTPKTDAPYSLVIGDTDLIFDDVRVYARVLSAGDIKHLASKRGVLGSPRQPYDPLKRTVVRVPAAIPAATVVGSIKKPTTIIKPSYQAGYARNASESENPKLWDGLVGAWLPSLGVTGETLRDVSGNGNHGTLTNMDAATDWVTTSKGLALDFDGSNDYVDCGTSQSTEVVDSISITGWVKKESNKSYNQAIINGWRNPSNVRVCFILSFWRNDGKLQFFHRNQYGQTDQVFSSIPVANNEWTHIATTSDERTVRHYINGKPAGSGTQNYQRYADTSYSSGVHIGELPVGNEYLDGSIGCLSLYNRVLSPTEIKQLYVDSLPQTLGRLAT